MIGVQTHNFSIKEVPGSAMAAADGSSSVRGAPKTANGGGILFVPPQRTHPLQRPQQSQSRRRSQGNNCPLSPSLTINPQSFPQLEKNT